VAAPDRLPANQGHAQDSFLIVGEGLYVEGRRSAVAPADAPAGARRFRFSRMGHTGTQLSRPIRVAMAKAMAHTGGGQTGVPAGYTYLGQFIDHDLTFDKSDLGPTVSPAEMLQNRSPALDLDSLYGAGPGSAGSAKFYEANHRKLKTGKTVKTSNANPGAKGFDVPRAGAKPLIPDPRNDENLAVAQTHCAFIRFHNRAVDELSSVPADQRFRAARRAVTKHYQWMIRHDYLPRICAPSVVDDVFLNGRKVFEVGVDPTDVPTMPVEFSVAAFRLGHSMVRASYKWNAVFGPDIADLETLFSFTATSGFLTETEPLPANWPADFRRLYDFAAAGHPGLKPPAGKSNRAMRIDTQLVDPLGSLFAQTIGHEEPVSPRIILNLAFRNLERAKMVKLASGQGMVKVLKAKGVTVKALTAAQIREGNGGASLAGLTAAQRKAIVDHTPLWFYILREAELNGGRLGGVGARIVAETFHRAMEGSRDSIVRDTAFKPEFGPDANTFNMPDLLFFAFNGKAALLNPVKPE
jgi:hypothetical protein